MNKMYRIVWKSNYTGFKSCGNDIYMYKDDAIMTARSANRLSNGIVHWVEEVA